MQWTRKSSQQKIKEREQWHLIFAWVPHKITCNRNGEDRWAWLEKIGRRSTLEPIGPHGMPEWVNRYASKEDAMYYAMGGAEPNRVRADKRANMLAKQLQAAAKIKPSRPAPPKGMRPKAPPPAPKKKT